MFCACTNTQCLFIGLDYWTPKCCKMPFPAFFSVVEKPIMFIQRISITGHGPGLNYLQYSQALKQSNQFIPFFILLGNPSTLPFFLG